MFAIEDTEKTAISDSISKMCSIVFRDYYSACFPFLRLVEVQKNDDKVWKKIASYIFHSSVKIPGMDSILRYLDVNIQIE